MEQRRKTGILIGLMVVMMITGGCGWFSGNNYPQSASTAGNPASASAPGVTRTMHAAGQMTYNYSIFAVNPDEGFLPGGESIRLDGSFPSTASAVFIYTVYIGDKVAKYDVSFLPAFSQNAIYVIAPSGDALGPVNVALYNKASEIYLAYAHDGYSYVDPFELFQIDPAGGILAGGTDVTLLGRFPVNNPITDFAIAQSQYDVTIGGTSAIHVANAAGQYVTSSAIYLQTPPGNAPGLVDVSLTLGIIYGNRTLVDGFRYLGDFELFSVDPDRGHISGLNPGPSTVELGGSFPVVNAIYDIATANSNYSIFFGNTVATFVQPPNAFPIISAETMYVSPPPASIAGVVDVNILSISGMYSQYAIVSDPLSNDYEYFTLMKIAEVYPSYGFLGVNTPVEVLTKLPITQDISRLSIAQGYYGVEIDGIAATFNTSVFPIIEITSAYGEYNAIMKMLTPPGASIGPKDVALIDQLMIEIPSQLPGGYTYTSLMELVYIYPPFGPTTGGTQIDVLVNIPTDDLNAPVTSFAQASAMYAVYIDDFTVNAATFDITRQPLIAINSIYAGYNAYFHMITPAGVIGPQLGTLRDIYSFAPDATKDDAFTYVSDSGVGQWINVEIKPNPVGPLQPGELEVSIEVTGTTEGAEVFIVPQGGDPANQDHRIVLTGSPDADPTTWTGTNAIAITTILYSVGTDVLFSDGHAAVFLQDEFGDIIGDDYTDPADDGTIAGNAQTARHFVIDTLPPLMLSNSLTADNFVSVPVGTLTSYKPDNVDGFTHPYTPPVAGRNVLEDFPWSDDIIPGFPTRTNDPTSQTGAQRFLNVASKSNGILITETFKPVISVDFIDVDIFNHIDYPNSATSTLNEDKFAPGNTYRAPAGFLFDGGSSFVNVFGTEREILLDAPVNPDLQARWELQGGSTPLPRMDNVYAEFTATGNSLTGGYVYSNGLDSIPFEEMRATWDLYVGADPLNEVDPMRLVLKFAAADRADIYYPRDDTLQPARAIMTRRSQQLDPLQVWWMREVNTAIIRDNIPADGITRAPDFAWVIDNQPRPILQNGDPVLPLYQFELWETAESANVDDNRDGPYTRILTGSWSALNTSYLPSLALANENRWHLLTVMAIDESGNAEQWPANLPIDVNDEIFIAQNVSSDSNWRRFYYPGIESEIDTRVTFEFWHDDGDRIIQTGEPYFGNQTIIPMPTVNSGLEVVGRFNGEVIAADAQRDIDWVLTQDGTLAWSGLLAEIAPLTLPNNGMFTNPQVLGDPDRLRPVSYALSATGNVPSGIDPTPVNIRFTVVPETDITEYLKNSQTDDAQPFKEFDRE